VDEASGDLQIHLAGSQPTVLDADSHGCADRFQRWKGMGAVLDQGRGQVSAGMVAARWGEEGRCGVEGLGGAVGRASAASSRSIGGEQVCERIWTYGQPARLAGLIYFGEKQISMHAVRWTKNRWRVIGPILVSHRATMGSVYPMSIVHLLCDQCQLNFSLMYCLVCLENTFCN
jgi:hypothetical protein